MAAPSKTRGGKPAKYRGDYHVRSRRITAAARANPDTPCWRCGRTLDQHPPHKSGANPRWHAGHVTPDGRDLRPEASTCNIDDSLARRHAADRDQRTDLTW